MPRQRYALAEEAVQVRFLCRFPHPDECPRAQLAADGEWECEGDDCEYVEVVFL